MLLIRAENGASALGGTCRAILYQSGGPSPLALPQNTWGGPRNSASRTSDCFNPLKAVELVEAAQQALAIGLPFNRHLTVHWEKANLNDAQAAKATGRLVKLIRDWVRKHGGTIAYAWVRENGPRKGSHSHLLLHIPEGLSMAFTRRWYAKVTGWRGRVPKHALKCVCIAHTARAGLSGSDWYLANLAWLVGYLLKGSDARTSEALGLSKSEEGGTIIGKRIAISLNLRPR